jgi:hypothetical protein
VVLQILQSLDDQLARAGTEWDRRIGVVGAVVRSRVIGSDDIVIMQLPVGDAQKVVVRRPALPKPE